RRFLESTTDGEPPHPSSPTPPPGPGFSRLPTHEGDGEMYTPRGPRTREREGCSNRRPIRTVHVHTSRRAKPAGAKSVHFAPRPSANRTRHRPRTAGGYQGGATVRR